ncbi:helix-turn-helix domain-containing protein [Mesorhizobium caraganae]|uniref:helix-turn-helix domain-containing protein n=1 Tax=Mesorhizobium caraganae TaxID=483206 RepID=UPI001786B7EF|nr:LysR family transcriptional regulator [Mesorhizobium caraganae]
MRSHLETAARELSLTQSAVSRQIKMLEEQRKPTPRAALLPVRAAASKAINRESDGTTAAH